MLQGDGPRGGEGGLAVGRIALAGKVTDVIDAAIEGAAGGKLHGEGSELQLSLEIPLSHLRAVHSLCLQQKSRLERLAAEPCIERVLLLLEPATPVTSRD